jgi:hypothetical protein
MSPPWIAYPLMARGSLGWSMGPGTYYWIEFKSWFGGMAPGARELFVRENAEPQGWTGFYSRLAARAH